MNANSIRLCPLSAPTRGNMRGGDAGRAAGRFGRALRGMPCHCSNFRSFFTADSTLSVISPFGKNGRTNGV